MTDPSVYANMTEGDDLFFGDAPSVLFKSHRWSEFFPSQSLPINRRMNAVGRFLIYFALLYFISTGSILVLILGIIGLTIVSYYRDKIKETGVKERDEVISVKSIEGGLKYGPRVSCSKPTLQNPFMNPSVNDYLLHVDRKPACPVTDPRINSKIDKLFMDGLYLGVDDVWERNNGQRQFVSQPNTTIPNNQGEFAQWLFGQPNEFCREKSICRNDLPLDHYGP